MNGYLRTGESIIVKAAALMRPSITADATSAHGPPVHMSQCFDPFVLTRVKDIFKNLN